MRARTAIAAAAAVAAGWLAYLLVAGFGSRAASELGGAATLASDVLDALVAEAQAESLDIKEAPCVGTPGGSYRAELAFPGRSMRELGGADVLIHHDHAWERPDSFSVRDGSITVHCYADAPGAAQVDRVRALVPAD
jgi:hypothetical protein